MSDEYVRARNRQLGRFAPPLKSKLAADRRGAVNELGFRLFAASLAEDASADALPASTVGQCVEDTLVFVIGAQVGGNRAGLTMDDADVEEATVLGKRLFLFFHEVNARNLAPFPVFRGCGWVDECVGDVLSDEALFEVKAGGRNFRSIDLRQVLVYCALNFASRAYDIPRICLVNPRMGVFLDEPVDRLCGELAGRPASDILSDIIQFISDTQQGYLGA